LRRGNSQSVAWLRKRFEMVNQLATFENRSILQNLEIKFQEADFDIHGLVSEPQSAGLLEKMSMLARERSMETVTEIMTHPALALGFRPETASWLELKNR